MSLLNFKGTRLTSSSSQALLCLWSKPSVGNSIFISNSVENFQKKPIDSHGSFSSLKIVPIVNPAAPYIALPGAKNIPETAGFEDKKPSLYSLSFVDSNPSKNKRYKLSSILGTLKLQLKMYLVHPASIKSMQV